MSGYSCSWCGTSVNRVWEIPKSRNREAQWVCKECHRGYFNGDLDANGVDDDTEYRTI